MRYIDLDKPLSDEDREYLRKWSRVHEIRDNDLRFASLTDEQKDAVSDQVERDRETDRKRLDENGEETEAEFDDDIIAHVEGLDTQEIRKALDKAGLDSSGEREQLEERLLNQLQDIREADDEDS